jgi:drug/metabolite transporter (DMT)-like permease
MEWIIIIVWLSIINASLGGQYVLNWLANQPKYIGAEKIDISPGVMTWWREISKLLWAVVAVVIEVIRGKKIKYLWPGKISISVIAICAFTGVIENIGFFYLPRYYSPHIYAPYINVYLAFLPFFGKFLYNAKIRNEHWIGIALVVIGLAIPHLEKYIRGSMDPKAVLDGTALLWILIINCCLCSQQVLNNKTVQTALPGVGPNALVVWREIFKMIFIWSALILFPLIALWTGANVPESVNSRTFETRVLARVNQSDKDFLLTQYKKSDQEYVLKSDLPKEIENRIESIMSSAEYHRFYSLFSGPIIPTNWWPILFIVIAGLSGYIYSYGFFNLSKFAAHYWVPYTNVYLALLPFVMLLFGKNVTLYQITGAIVVTAGLMVGVSDVSRHRVEEIEKKYKA